MPPVVKTKTSVGEETVDETVARAKALNASISAKELANPVSQPKLTEPALPPEPDRSVVNAVANETQSFIQAQSEEATRLKQLREQQSMLMGEESLSSIYSGLQDQYGITDNLKELKDVQLQLANNKTDSEIRQSRIAGAAGQTYNQGAREITQEQREQAIRDAGLAARAAVLQGNIETSTSLVNQAINLTYQDRTLRNQNLLNQINDLRGTVDQQTQQLLDKEQRKYEEDQANIQRVKDAVDAAMVSGAATSADIAQLTDPRLTDEQRLSLAQGIVARGATEERSLDMAAKRADIAQGWTSLDLRREELKLSQQKLAAELADSGNKNGTLDGKPQTQAQALVNSYANRLLESEGIFSQVADEFADVLAFGGVLPNILQSSERQQYEQAKRNFVNAVLRRESGAVISDQEFDNAEKQYFPQAGDAPEVVQQKAENRNTVINNFYRESNVPRPVFPGDIIVDESTGKSYQVGEDGVTLKEI